MIWRWTWELCEEIRAIIESLADQKALRFRIHLVDPCERMERDARKLRQILLNLLGNAVEFTERGDVSLEIGRAADRVLFRVRDTGIGFRAADTERPIEPFWQGDRSRTRSSGGTGLGIAISRRLAHLPGGDITVENRAGAGSTFTLCLPHAPAAASATTA